VSFPRIAALASVIGLSLAGASGCAVHQTQEYVVSCNVQGVAQHDFQTTDASLLSRVSGLLIAKPAAGEPGSVRPVGVQFSGTVASVACQRPDSSVAFFVQD
jgi:hypothetical protein